jgi:hypothetical protein
MREETQNSVNLKLIVFFDPEDHTYGIWAHNLTLKRHRGMWTSCDSAGFPRSP